MLQRKRNRLKEFDYSQTGYYFITICTDGMIEYFGNIQNSEMQLNTYGNIVLNKLKELSNRYSYTELDEFVIMPNHVHVIMIIDNFSVGVGTALEPSDNKLNVNGTGRDLSLQKQIKTKSLSELIGVFKTTSSKEIHQMGLINFKWQRSFYDRVVRNEKELYQIRKYIRQNPLKWEIEKDLDNLDI